ncbi:MAG: excinuclease ABC subunit UvrC [Pseudomonadota bacterium]
MAFDAERFLKQVSSRPGVYTMRDQAGSVLYVGKAGNLKKRLSQYFQSNRPDRTARMVAQIAHIDVTVSSSNTEALLLEVALIKSLKPKFNVLLKDDKNYPYLCLSGGQFPRLSVHYGSQMPGNTYFGPYASKQAVEDLLISLQKLFQIRSCKDTFFKNRMRPCLQYQIKRCSAPCVQTITESDYALDVERVKAYLSGKEDSVIAELMVQMKEAANSRRFERAVQLRDTIARLRVIQEEQCVYKNEPDCDVLAAAVLGDVGVVQLMSVRSGKIQRAQSFNSRLKLDMEGEATTAPSLLAQFMAQFYISEITVSDIPSVVYVPEGDSSFADFSALEEALSLHAGKGIHIQAAKSRTIRAWQTMARDSAIEALNHQTTREYRAEQRWMQLQTLLNLPKLDKIHGFDVSHHAGEGTITACVAWTVLGRLKSEYRKWSIKTVTNGDDYAALSEACKIYLHEHEMGTITPPSLLLIDGGLGQCHAVLKVYQELAVVPPPILGIAKGPARKSGLETLWFLADGYEAEIALAPYDAQRLLLQMIRDDAHRFAIKGQRKQLLKRQTSSPLEGLPGIGPKRRQNLITFFGGAQGLQQASTQMIATVPGISRALAEKIYAFLHPTPL